MVFSLCFQDVIADKLSKIISFYIKFDKWSWNTFFKYFFTFVSFFCEV